MLHSVDDLTAVSLSYNVTLRLGMHRNIGGNLLLLKIVLALFIDSLDGTFLVAH